jgi:beta-N-acetylhexosaminidase
MKKSFQTMTHEDVRRAAGNAVICGFDGTKVTPELREIVREVQPLGLILFARNVESPEQVAELNHDLQSLSAELPLWVAVDQEGGRVARLRAPFTEWPPMATLGRSGDETLAYRFAAALAEELKAVGITLDYAPVLDIHTNPSNPVIGDRALSEDAATVALVTSRCVSE